MLINCPHSARVFHSRLCQKITKVIAKMDPDARVRTRNSIGADFCFSA